MSVNQLDIHHIRRILPQDYPFLMLDRVIDYKEHEYLTAVKNITAGEWYFQADEQWTGTFPEVFILEAAAQAAIVLYHVSRHKEGDINPGYILGKTEAEFFDPVRIGDQLKIHSQATKMLSGLGYMDTDIFVQESKVAAVKVLYSIRRKSPQGVLYA